MKAISAYAFSTENWSRSPDEVRFLMGFNRDVIRRRRDEMHDLGVRVRWAGRAPRLWRSVIKELQVAEEMTKDNDVLTLTMCVNYGGRAELADAARAIAPRGRGRPAQPRQDRRARPSPATSTSPSCPDADLVWRTSGEQRLSNFMLWQAAYSEMVFTDVLWPDVDRGTCGRPSRRTPAATAATAARSPNQTSQPDPRPDPPTRPSGRPGRSRRSPACG